MWQQSKGVALMNIFLKRDRENNKVLKSCPKHSFDIDIRKDRVAERSWRCSNCGGDIDNLRKYWFEKGLEHGEINHS